MPPTVVSARGEQRLRGGHPWIYRADVADVRADGGDIVLVRSPRGQIVGSALFSDRSQITLRMLTHGEQPADAALVRRRIETAIAFRGVLAIDATAYRLVHGEADRLPSLIVDRYGDYLVVQTLSQGMDRLLPVVVSSLTELLQPRGILARNDPKARVLDGLEQRVDVLAGDVPEAVTVTETGIEYDVDLRRGQKTGLFLDQRENRAAAAAYARGRMLDCFSYHGGSRWSWDAAAPRPSRSTSPRTRCPGSARTPRATASSSRRGPAMSSTSCAAWIASASGSTRSSSTRRRSPRTRRRW